MPSKIKRITVTGADGFIGSHLAERLVREGHRVTAFVLYHARHDWGWIDEMPKEIREQIEVIPGDLRDYQSVKRAVAGAEVVFHLAALISIPYSYHAPESYLDTNVKGTYHIVQACRELQVERLVHTSTSEVYGTAQFVPIHEKHPLNPQSPYAASKAGADQLALSYYYSYQLPVSIVRPFNTYGPRQSARAVIPSIMMQIAAGKKQIRLGDLRPTRDFTYVKDTVDGFVEASRSDRLLGEVVNVGSNYEISIGKTAALIAEVMNADVEIVLDPERLRPPESEVQRLWADNGKMTALTGWKPAYGGEEGLRKGLSETAAWFAQADHLLKYKQDVYHI
ncbi:NAD-dependent 4,6-dehydratase LegB [Cohnella hongkongensis]|uniref:NAD-dependent 4,6-dehydratase LegB n=1 Tax=Cohnella hongkongensis TaxID=178337 RepID=A0ABV9FN09_9BACL